MYSVLDITRNNLAYRQKVEDDLRDLIRNNFTDTAKTAATGTEVDDKFAAQIIGKDIPIFVGGQALLGCRIIEGPFLYDVGGAGFCDMVVSCAMAATPTASRTISYLNLNGTKSWTLADGFIGTAFSAMEINFLYGTEAQTPLASSIVRYGARAVPYRSHICVELKNIPLAVFANTIPFVSMYVYESDYLTRNDGLRKLAQFARFDSSEYEIEVSGHDPFWIVAQQSTFVEYVQALRTTVGRNWNLVPSDKLRIFENAAAVTPIALIRSDVVENTVQFTQDDPLSVPTRRSMGFINTSKDNDFDSVKAVRARFPVALSSSEDTENVDIPIGMDAVDARAIVNKSLLIDDIARDKISCRVQPHMRGLEPGDIIAPDLDDDVDFEAMRVTSVARNAADFTADIVAERVELALLATGPSITSNGGGPSASITINEGTTSVTTVTADDTDATDAFAIVGGADASSFTIDADTGVLEFGAEPDYEVPTDADVDNVYRVIVQASGNGLTDTQTISVTVANVDEGTGSESDSDLLLLLLA